MDDISKVLSYLDSELSSKRFAYSQPESGSEERYTRLEVQIEMLDEVREYVASLQH